MYVEKRYIGASERENVMRTTIAVTLLVAAISITGVVSAPETLRALHATQPVAKYDPAAHRPHCRHALDRLVTDHSGTYCRGPNDED